MKKLNRSKKKKRPSTYILAWKHSIASQACERRTNLVLVLRDRPLAVECGAVTPG